MVEKYLKTSWSSVLSKHLKKKSKKQELIDMINMNTVLLITSQQRRRRLVDLRKANLQNQMLSPEFSPHLFGPLSAMLASFSFTGKRLLTGSQGVWPYSSEFSNPNTIETFLLANFKEKELVFPTWAMYLPPTLSIVAVEAVFEPSQAHATCNTIDSRKDLHVTWLGKTDIGFPKTKRVLFMEGETGMLGWQK